MPEHEVVKGEDHLLNPEKVKLALKMYESKDYAISEITEATGVSKKSIYRYLNKNREL